MSYRLIFSAYLSTLVHLALLIYVLLPPNPTQKLICGLDFPFTIKTEPEVSFSFEFEKGNSEPKELNPQSEQSQSNQQTPPAPPGPPSKTKEKIDLQTRQKNLQKLKEKYGNSKWQKLLKELEKSKSIANAPRVFDNVVRGGVSDKYIYRHRHYEDMVVKDVLPTVYDIDKSFESEIDRATSKLEDHNQRNRIIEEFRRGLDGEEPIEIDREPQEDKNKPVLRMSEQERNEYFDRTLTKSKEKQLEDFMQRFLGYDPDDGDLPLMFRDLYYKNLQRLAYSFSSDSSYFTTDYFEENLNKEDYLKNSMHMLSELRGTKTATEILFSVENIYEIQQRAIFQYLQNKNLAETYQGTKKKRIESIKGVIEKYRPILKQKKIKNRKDAVTLYTQKRLQIMDYLLKTTPDGYRKNDALFEKGKILFEKSQHFPRQREKLIGEALQIWQSIAASSNEKDFFNREALHQLQPILREYQSANPQQKQLLTGRINNILHNRLSKFLQEKKQREDRLLWPKK